MRFGERGVHSSGPTAAARVRVVRGSSSAGRRSPGWRKCLPWDGGGNKSVAGDRAGTGRRWQRLSGDARRAATTAEFFLEAPNCGAPAEPSESRFHRETPARRSGAGLFFDGGPIVTHPVANRFFIPLDGLALGFLGTPAQSVQQTADMIRVIADPEAVRDPLRHPRTGPQVGFKSSGLGTAQQTFFQLTAVGRTQSLWTPRDWASGQGTFSTPARRRVPAPHAAPIHAYATGHFDRRHAVPQQTQSPKSSSFLFLRTHGRSHHALREEV